MVQAVDAIKNDPRLLEMAHELSVLKAQFDEALAKAEEGGTMQAWSRLQDLRLEVIAAGERQQAAAREAARLDQEGDVAGAVRERERAAACSRERAASVGQIMEEIARGGEALEALEALHKNVIVQVRVSDAERRRIESARAYARIEEVEAVLARFMVIVRDELERAVPDADARRAVLSGLVLKVRLMFEEVRRERLALAPAAEGSDAGE